MRCDTVCRAGGKRGQSHFSKTFQESSFRIKLMYMLIQPPKIKLNKKQCHVNVLR